MDIVQIQQVLAEHKTSYRQQPDKVWLWSCSFCGEDKPFETRPLCEMETRRHWAEQIAGLDTPSRAEGSDEPEPEQEQPKGLEIFSSLVYDVDCNLLTMPQARKELGEWFFAQTDKAKMIEDGRVRMRRLKQITDALYEEFWSLAGSQS